MKRKKTGVFNDIRMPHESYRAFIPDPLPPKPPLQLEGRLRDTLDSALIAIGRLDTIATILPDTQLFLYMYIRKEALLSSQIEGTQSSLSDLLLFENEAAPGVPLDDVREVSNYVAAMQHGLDRISNGFPISSRLLREIHQVLLSKGRGSKKTPGEFRRSQNWVGGTRPGNAVYVPPPAEAVGECMSLLEKFLHDDPVKTPTLIKAALAHVQFESVHPFLDGNGRLGRLLITLLLCAEEVLAEPILYLSLYFKTHRDRYYDLLQKVRTEGDWESWIQFFARGVLETATQAVQTARNLTQLFEADRKKIQGLGKPAGSALRTHRALTQRPILSAKGIAEATGLTLPTIMSSLTHLQEIEIVREVTGKKRNRLFAYEDYLATLSEGTEPLS